MSAAAAFLVVFVAGGDGVGGVGWHTFFRRRPPHLLSCQRTISNAAAIFTRRIEIGVAQREQRGPGFIQQVEGEGL